MLGLLVRTNMFPLSHMLQNEFIQASGRMSSEAQLLRERAAIHGSIPRVRLKTDY